LGEVKRIEKGRRKDVSVARGDRTQGLKSGKSLDGGEGDGMSPRIGVTKLGGKIFKKVVGLGGNCPSRKNRWKEGTGKKKPT